MEQELQRHIRGVGNNLLVHAQAELEADWQVLSRKQEQNLFKDLQKEKN